MTEHELPILNELVVVLTACLVSVYVLRKIRVPAVVAYLLTGVVVGPGVLNLIGDIPTIETIAQIGLVFLLFAVGLRFSLEELWRLRWLVLGAGSLQVVLTILATAAIARFAGLSLPISIFLGFLVVQSSTTVMLKVAEERGEIDTPQARLMLSVSIFQDLGVIPLMLLVPVLGQAEDLSYAAAGWTLLTSALAVALIIVAARFLIPWVMERVAQTRNREMFTFTALLIALGTAYFAERIGLSLSLGALVAGIVISESEYSHQILAEVGPVRDALSSLFFVSIGMLLDPRLWIEQPLLSIGLVVGTIVLKAVIVIAIALVFRQGLRVAILGAVALAQVGEFAFVLVQAGQPLGLLPGELYQEFLLVSVATMALAPLGMALAPQLAIRAQQGLRLLRLWRRRGLVLPRGAGRSKVAAPARPDVGEHAADLVRHVIIVGYGVNGRNVARVLRQMKVRFTVIELNPVTVRSIRQQGEPVVYGDATQQEILYRAGILDARVLLIAIPDPRAARRVVVIARSLAPKLTIVVRTRFVAEVEKLRQLGADDVVPEEFETSIALVGRLMAIYGASERMIERQEDLLRREQYEFLRVEEARPVRRPALREMLAHADFAEFALPADSPAVGRTLRDLDLRGRTGASVMGISRGQKIIGNPGPDFELQAGDVLGVLGSAEEVATAQRYLLQGETGENEAPGSAGE